MREPSLKPRPPFHYKLMESSLSDPSFGRMAGSAQPGGFDVDLSPEIISSIIEALTEGQSMEETAVPAKLCANLHFLHAQNISVIYNVIPQHNGLTKYSWENHFEGKTYITEIDGVSIGIDNHALPGQEQLRAIADDAMMRMSDGNNIMVHCEGGLGRTGTVLAAIYMKVNNISDSKAAITHIRGAYSSYAIEPHQEESLEVFAGYTR